ncbi:MAG: bifunctional hydroxymethylpyrimidine kinase/phosphomethylpyrimidine kinase [Thermoplasmata archaeon]|nr:MAG: bifunctional hydroxymethylpyrimidine kinase/phosphomethylpyrimidine kinase [Thermoplasmata archaeon]
MHKVALTIGGSDSSGGAGIQADLKSFAIAEVHGTSVITCITSQNTKGVKSIYPLPLNEVESQINAIMADFDIGAAKTGMLYSPDVVKLVAEKMKGVRLVVDPVLSSTTGYSLSSPGIEDAIKEYLLPRCYIIMPNAGEAEKLCGIKVESVDDARKACISLHKMGAKNVLIKGGHIEGDAADILFDGKKFYIFALPKMDRKAHGSGCTFSAFLAALLAKGYALSEAAGRAKAYTWSAIAGGVSPGGGVDIVWQRGERIPVADAITWQMDGDYRRQYEEQMERAKIWISLQNAVDELLSFLPPAFVPEVGINFVYAMEGASSHEGICGIEGRIGRKGRVLFQSGECRFGASKHISSIVLACMKHDKNMRSAMNVAYSEKILTACNKAGLECASFDRKYEPPNISTMEWGTDHAIAELGHVPDVVWDKGGIGKEAMIRIIGRNPDEVLSKVKAIAGCLR